VHEPLLLALDHEWGNYYHEPSTVGTSMPLLESPLCPGTGSGCRLEGGVNRRIVIITFNT
jgi:hypothetical protein